MPFGVLCGLLRTAEIYCCAPYQALAGRSSAPAPRAFTSIQPPTRFLITVNFDLVYVQRVAAVTEL